MEPTKDQIHSFLFMTLVSNFHLAAMQQMGKMLNPISNKIERDLKQAKMSIDMIEMLKTKTAGNLNADEELLIKRVLSEMQLNYVDELKKGESAPEENKSDGSKETDRTNGEIKSA